MRRVFFPFCTLLLGSLLPAQITKNWVVNGDFEKGLTGWTGSGPGGNPKVEAFMTDGLKTSNAFAINAGGNVFKPPHAPYVLTQKILFIPNVTYEVVMDVAIKGVGFGNAQAGIFTIKVNGNVVVTRDFGTYSAGTLPRDRLCARFKLAKGGSLPFSVEIARPRFIWSTRTPRHYVDNIELRIVTDPSFCIRGDRKLGGTNIWQVTGKPSAFFFVFLAPKLLAAPVPVPGFKGVYALDVATTIPLYGGNLNTSGIHQMQFQMPSIAALDKVPLWFQALQADKTAGLSFGPWHNWGFHQ